MKIIKTTYRKEFKKGLPNFSNITASVGFEVEWTNGEKVDHNRIWEEINQQLSIQVESIEPDWLDPGKKDKKPLIKPKSKKRILHTMQ